MAEFPDDELAVTVIMVDAEHKRKKGKWVVREAWKKRGSEAELACCCVPVFCHFPNAMFKTAVRERSCRKGCFITN